MELVCSNDQSDGGHKKMCNIAVDEQKSREVSSSLFHLGGERCEHEREAADSFFSDSLHNGLSETTNAPGRCQEKKST